MAYKDEWIEVTMTTTSAKQRVRKASVGGYGKVGRSTYLYRDIFDQTNSIAVCESIEEIDTLFGKSSSGGGYKNNEESKDAYFGGKSCANCKQYSRANEKCVKKQIQMEEFEAINTICPEWRLR